MADNVKTKDTNVHTDEIATHNGVATVPDDLGRLPQAQIDKIAFGADGDSKTVDTSQPFPTADFSDPLTCLAAGGLTVTAGVATPLLSATAGRVKATAQHTGASGVLWVRWDGGTAAPGVGEAVYPGEQWSEWTGSAVSVYFEGTGSCRVATTEIAAG